MHLFSANIRDNPDLAKWQVLRDILVLFRMFGNQKVIGAFQEINDRSDRKAIRRYFTRTKFRMLIRDQAIPLILNRLAFAVKSVVYVRAHGGREGVSPHRGYGKAIISFRFRPRIKPFAVVWTHMVSSAWSDRDVKDKEWRKKMWNLHWKMMTVDINNLVASGFDVYFMGDLNRGDIPLIHPNQEVLHHNGVDWSIFIPGDNSTNDVDRVAHGEISLKRVFTDHKPIWAEVDVDAA